MSKSFVTDGKFVLIYIFGKGFQQITHQQLWLRHSSLPAELQTLCNIAFVLYRHNA